MTESVRVYHNARCSKSRSACQLLEEKGVQLEVVEYLKNPPSRDELADLLNKLGLPAEAIVRKGEDIYLYRLSITPEAAKVRFHDYLTAMNQLRERPQWYNAITNNCTTSIRTQHDKTKRTPWDWRILVNGFADEMLYEIGAFHKAGLPFAALKKMSHINAAAKAADASSDFSRLIRTNLPSFLPDLRIK